MPILRTRSALAVLLAGASLAAGSFVLGIRAQHLQPAPDFAGELLVAGDAIGPRSCPVGDFEITWGGAEAPSLTVRHRAIPDRRLWWTRPGHPFLHAAAGEVEVIDHRASYTLDDAHLATWPTQQVSHLELVDDRLVVTGILQGEDVDPIDWRLTFEAAGERALRLEASVDGGGANRLVLDHGADPEERFLGFGVQFSRFDLTGLRFPVLVGEQGVGRGLQPLSSLIDLAAGSAGSWHSSYAPLPHYLTSELRSVAIDVHEPLVFDLTEAGRVRVELFAGEAAAFVYAGDSPARLVEEHTAIFGRMRALPDWAISGPIVGIQGGTERVRRVLDLLAERGTPVAGVWLQDWVGQRETAVGKQLWWNWELDEAHYPEWDELVARIRADGARLLLYVNPFLADLSDRGGYRRHLFAEAKEKGLLVATPEGEPYLVPNTDFSAALVDLTNPDARAWMLDVLADQVLAVGADGWMADYGEALPFDAVLANGEPMAVHNAYPELWARLNREAIRRAGREEDAVVFLRSGWLRSPRDATLFWLGDQLVTWDGHDGIKTAVTGMLSSGLSGYSFVHSDVGGYTTVDLPLVGYRRSEELLLRWMELGAFTTVLRTHEGNAPEANVQFHDSERTLAHFDRCARIHAAWLDTRRELVREAAATGLPVARHPFLHHPREPRLLAIEHSQFLLGTDLLVRPVLDPGVEAVEALLPPGRWVHAWSGDTFGEPDRVTEAEVAAPLGEPAVFAREGSAAGRDFLQGLREQGLLAPHDGR